ncbi:MULTISPECIES: hypothetical protein [unclassified Bradyrhizobium]|uniref:hypothetical protein n=1 Tax=unclassified Bradyrhizobium TaxID=2631580 RepID=UPI002917133F|nr:MULTISPECIES: hypothetical protein [unclassified Bradyrhizobium]
MRSAGITLFLLLAVLGCSTAAEAGYQGPIRFFADAGEAVASLNDGLDRAITTKTRLPGDAKLDVLRRKASNLDAQLAGAIGHKEYLISSLRLYLANPTTARWRMAHAEMNVLSEITGGIMIELKDDQPVLVELAGPSLVSNLVAVMLSRASILQELSTLPEPTSDAERSALKVLVDRYDELVQQLRRLNVTLDQYAVSFRSDAEGK